MAAIALAFAAMGATAMAAPTVVFQADFEASTAESVAPGGTTLANLNLGTAIGTWSGWNETRPISAVPTSGIHLDSLGANKIMCSDRDQADIGFDISANLTQPVVLADGGTVTFKFVPRRTGGLTAGVYKHAYIMGKDASGAISFYLRVYIGAGTLQYFQYSTTADAPAFASAAEDTHFLPTGTSQAETANNFTSAANIISANMETLTLSLSAAGYTFNYVPGADQAGLGEVAYTSAVLPYAGTATQLTRINFVGSDECGMYIDDFIVTALGGASVGDWDKM
ncbi:MAG: hypothetical protein BWZ10_01097 [candidate division BRC1 bacterium ADurb.BinA364]|nr:MAG: hypothetical protein BWZ10_01097 [candidate division BRC1 bacterium ADurb.BinA364]